MPLGQDTQPADQANIPVMPGTTEEVVEPLNVRKSSRVQKIRPKLQEFIQPLKLKKRRDKATIEAEKAAAAEEKVRKAEEKVVTRAKAVNCLAALHIPVDGVVKTPRPLICQGRSCNAEMQTMRYRSANPRGSEVAMRGGPWVCVWKAK